MWVEGKKILRASAPPGATFLFSLSRNPVPEFHTSFDILRFYISQASLDELSFDRGLRRAAGLNDCLGSQDPVMHGLAAALLDPVEQANERSALFVDHIALAFHAHVTDVYGNSAARADPVSGGLIALAAAPRSRFHGRPSGWRSYNRAIGAGVRFIIGVFRARVQAHVGRGASSMAHEEAHRARAGIAVIRGVGSRRRRHRVRLRRSKSFHESVCQAQGIGPRTMAANEPPRFPEIAINAVDRVRFVLPWFRFCNQVAARKQTLGGLNRRL
jgi:hypothetical protein